MLQPHRRHYDFGQPLDDCWELIPDPGWTCNASPGCARFASTIAGNAEVFLRPCAIDGDTFEIGLVEGAARAGIFRFGFIVGFEYIIVELDLRSGAIQVLTHEAHKRQPRFAGEAPAGFRNIKLRRERDRLPGLPYSGVGLTLLLDDHVAARVGQIDFLPESFFMFSLKGPGEVSLSHLTITGPPRPRPEYVHVGVWQQDTKPTTARNVDALIEGVNQAARAGVEILVTPETSLTGLRPDDAEFHDRHTTQAQLRRFQDAVARVPGAPYTLIGYPEYVPGTSVECAEIDEVLVNCHRFVRPDGTLGPPMYKVHACEQGMWHGRRYNLQRVSGVEVALGICHDGHYQDVWSVPVMGGARLCLHPANGGKLSGDIPSIVNGYRGLGEGVDCFWVTVNAGGGAAIVYPTHNRKVPDPVLAVPADLQPTSPTYPKYSSLGDLLAHARIRLWDASGAYPLRTLRAGARVYAAWSSLIPPIQDV